jgi:steroid 5-alpha reductase family enzyme
MRDIHTYIALGAAVALAMSLAMAFAWSIGREHGRSGWIDAIWALATGVAGVILTLWPVEGEITGRQMFVAGMVAAWAGRLSLHIAMRSGKYDNPRYLELRSQWGPRWNIRLFALLQTQALAGCLLAIAAMASARDQGQFPTLVDQVAGLVFIAAIVGEGIADAQVARFRRERGPGRSTCDSGLWSWSRHPNYFFEWLIWASLAGMALGSDTYTRWDLLALIGPVMMYVLLVHVSGIPPLEAHMLRSRGQSYRDYQRRVRAFWPIPRWRSLGRGADRPRRP